MAVLVSIGIPAYNEEKNIHKLLGALLKQKTDRVLIDEIIVISSGSTDKTNAIVEEFLKQENRVTLMKQSKRGGKAAAINEFLKVANNEILVLESADTIPREDTIERLCLPFEDSAVGMTGAHPVPTNDINNYMGYTVHLLWEFHHRIALRSPKCGKLVTFRKIIGCIPEDTAVDEAWIECELRRRGYRLVYVPEAIVYNRGPETIEDFLRQRRRIAYGHLDLRNKLGCDVSSWNINVLLPAISEIFPYSSPNLWGSFMAAFILENVGRFLGYYDFYVKRKRHEVREISKSTKNVDPEYIKRQEENG